MNLNFSIFTKEKFYIHIEFSTRDSREYYKVLEISIDWNWKWNAKDVKTYIVGYTMEPRIKLLTHIEIILVGMIPKFIDIVISFIFRQKWRAVKPNR